MSTRRRCCRRTRRVKGSTTSRTPSACRSLIESYVSAAMKISRRAVGDRTLTPTQVTYAAPGGLVQDKHIEGLPLGTRGGLLVRHTFPLDAEYEFSVTGGFGGPAGAAPGTAESAGDAEFILGIERKRVAHEQTAARTERQAFDVLVLDEPARSGIGDLRRRERAIADGAPADLHGRRDVTLNQRSTRRGRPRCCRTLHSTRPPAAASTRRHRAPAGRESRSRTRRGSGDAARA